MKKWLYIVLFLVFNFGALGIGRFLMNSGPVSVWYIELSKAPWTPSGWVFGVAWSIIMFFFSLYMAMLLNQKNSNHLWSLFAVQWGLNVSWNWIFFSLHQMFFAELVLISLTSVIAFMMFKNWNSLKYYTLLIIPYLLWMLVANSLNIYAIIYN